MERMLNSAAAEAAAALATGEFSHGGREAYILLPVVNMSNTVN
jgi:hypothetical protein